MASHPSCQQGQQIGLDSDKYTRHVASIISGGNGGKKIASPDSAHCHCRLPTSEINIKQHTPAPATPLKRERVPPSSPSPPSHLSTVVHQASTRGRLPLLLQTANPHNFNFNFNSWHWHWHGIGHRSHQPNPPPLDI